MTAEYPAGYTPMTDDDAGKVMLDWVQSDLDDTPLSMFRAIERAVLARLPKPDTAERDALVRRIDEWLDWRKFTLTCSFEDALFLDIRAHLIGGWE